ncbi:hypothetical protein BHM03_00038743 [Ensete ventricosum]|nr:hypothetical protein BHM03_00038743 [Ensete ventricosum]
MDWWGQDIGCPGYISSSTGTTTTKKRNARERDSYLVVVGEIVVGHCNGGGGHDSIDKPISAVGERAMVHPNMAGAEDGNTIPVGHGSPSIVGRRAADHGIAGGLAVMDVEAVDDDIGDILDGDASSIGDVDVGAAAVDGLETVHDELLLERDHHVTLKSDPQGVVLDDRIPQCSRPWIHGIIIPGVRHHVEFAVTAADGIPAEANPAVSQRFPVQMPVGIAPPAVVDWVAGAARRITKKRPPSCAVAYAPDVNNKQKVNSMEGGRTYACYLGYVSQLLA